MIIEKIKGIIKISLTENFDVEKVNKFRTEIYKLIDEGQTEFIIDFHKCKYIDSTGLGVLISIFKKVNEKQGSIKLCSINDFKVMKVFELTRLDKVFEVYSSFEEASKKKFRVLA